MNATFIVLVALVETIFVGGMFLLYPRFARRGLLFGVYVGEATWSSDQARDVTRGYYQAMIAWLLFCLVAQIAVGLAVPAAAAPALLGFFPLAIVAGFAVFYVRAYFRAKTFAVNTPVPAVALLQAGPETSLLFPYAALLVGIIAGIVAITYAAVYYPALPGRVPTHFGASGTPDAWRPKSFASVMLLPLMSLFMGVGLGVICILTARAKRAVRYPKTAVSLEAQVRFRTAVTRMTSAISLLVSVMLSLMSIAAVRVGLGVAKGLPWPVMALTLVIVAIALGGSLYIGLRYGQGGSRWEKQAADAPLTNGLADNSHWVLGVFYVNRDDPSYMVEDRFGLGYTLNLGNWKAVAVIVGFIGGLLALVIVAAFWM
ncbi:MAG: DUF1648 domain-containing protein [Bacteroidales bacterium]